MAIFKDYLENKSPLILHGALGTEMESLVMIFLANSGQPSTFLKSQKLFKKSMKPM